MQSQRSLKVEEGSRRDDQSDDIRRISPTVATFEDGGRGPQGKKCRPQEESDHSLSPRTHRRNTALLSP